MQIPKNNDKTIAMFVTSRYLLAPSILYHGGWLLFIPQILSELVSCPPPNFPIGGKYTPAIKEYEVGMVVHYKCDTGFLEFYENNRLYSSKSWATCNSSGHWSRETPFCDNPITLKSMASPSEENAESLLIDDNMATCIQITEGGKVLQYSLEHETTPIIVRMCFAEVEGMLRVFFPPYGGNYETSSDRLPQDKCGEMDVRYTNFSKTKSMTIEVSPDKNSSSTVCEIKVFAKENAFCDYPPDKSVGNGHLEVSRSKAFLHCRDGFKETHDRKLYATCGHNTWSYLGLQCVNILCDPVVRNISSEEGGWENEGNFTKYTVGTNRTLKCKLGYHSDGNPLTVTCLKGGKWTYTLATCEKDKPEQKYQTLALILVCSLILIILLGFVLFFIRKKKSRRKSLRNTPGKERSDPVIPLSNVSSEDGNR